MMKLLFNRNFLLPLAIILGFVYPVFSVHLAPYVVPILAVAMTIAAIHVPNTVFKDLKRMVLPAFWGMILSYGVLGSFLILAAIAGPFPEKISLGLILIGVAPPAAAVMPFTAALKGDLPFTIVGVVVSYLSALLIIPLALFILMGDASYDIGRLATILAWIVLFPMVVSRLVLYFRWEVLIQRFDGPVTNLSFFLVLYAIVGVNRHAFLTEPALLFPLSLTVFAATFLMGETVSYLGRLFQVTPARRVSMILMATLKNQGVAGGLALSLFDREAAIPSAIYAVFMMLSFIWLSFRYRKVNSG